MCVCINYACAMCVCRRSVQVSVLVCSFLLLLFTTTTTNSIPKYTITTIIIIIQPTTREFCFVSRPIPTSITIIIQKKKLNVLMKHWCHHHQHLIVIRNSSFGCCSTFFWFKQNLIFFLVSFPIFILKELSLARSWNKFLSLSTITIFYQVHWFCKKFSYFCH